MPLISPRIQITISQDAHGNFVSNSNASDQSSIRDFLTACSNFAAATISSLVDTSIKFGLEESSVVRFTKKGTFVLDFGCSLFNAINNEMAIHGSEPFEAFMYGSIEGAIKFGFNAGAFATGSALGFAAGATSLNPLIAGGTAVSGGITASLWAEDVYNNEILANGKTPEQLVNGLFAGFYENEEDTYNVQGSEGFLSLTDGKLTFSPSDPQYDPAQIALEIAKNIQAAQKIEEDSDIIPSQIIIKDPDRTSPDQVFNVAKDQDGFIGKSGSNVMQGSTGDDSYYFPYFNGQNIINDPDGGGVIKIGNPPLTFEGNAIPKLDPETGEIIPGQWTLNGYDLIRSGDNLVLVPAGSDPSSSETPRITINNFPFDSQNAFGLTLGKVKTGQLAGAHNVNDPESLGAPVFGVKDKRGRYFTAAVIDNGTASPDYGIKTYNAQGQTISTQKLTDVSLNLAEDGSGTVKGIRATGQSSKLANGNVAFIYAVEETVYGPNSVFIHGKSSAFLAIANANGQVISNQLVGTVEAQSYSQLSDVTFFPTFVVGSSNGSNSLCFTSGGNKFYCSKFSNGGGVSTEFKQVSDLTPFQGSPDIEYVTTLSSGHRIQSNNPSGYSISAPILRDMTAAEVPPTYSLAPGENLETLDSLQKAIINFEQAVDGETAAKLEITPASGARILINNVNTDNIGSSLDIDAFGLSEAEIAARSKEVDAREFNMDDFFDSKIALRRRGIDLQRRAANSSSTDDELLAEAKSDNPEVYTILTLPVVGGDDMKLIFPGFSRERFLNESRVILGYVPNPITTVMPTNASHVNATVWPTGYPNHTIPGIAGPTPPPQIGSSTSSNPAVAIGASIGAGLFGLVLAAVGVKKAVESERGQQFMTSLGNGLRAIDPRNWFSSRVEPARVGALAEIAIAVQEATFGETALDDEHLESQSRDSNSPSPSVISRDFAQVAQAGNSAILSN